MNSETGRTLVEELDALRVEMWDRHGNAMSKLDTLDAHMRMADGELRTRLAEVLEADLVRKSEIAELVETLSHRIGVLPMRTPAPALAHADRPFAEPLPQFLNGGMH